MSEARRGWTARAKVVSVAVVFVLPCVATWLIANWSHLQAQREFHAAVAAFQQVGIKVDLKMEARSKELERDFLLKQWEVVHSDTLMKMSTTAHELSISRSGDSPEADALFADIVRALDDPRFQLAWFRLERNKAGNSELDKIAGFLRVRQEAQATKNWNKSLETASVWLKLSDQSFEDLDQWFYFIRFQRRVPLDLAQLEATERWLAVHRRDRTMKSVYGNVIRRGLYWIDHHTQAAQAINYRDLRSIPEQLNERRKRTPTAILHEKAEFLRNIHPLLSLVRDDPFKEDARLVALQDHQAERWADTYVLPYCRAENYYRLSVMSNWLALRRARTGQYPSSLTDMPELRDGFTGKPFEYAVDADNYRLAAKFRWSQENVVLTATGIERG